MGAIVRGPAVHEQGGKVSMSYSESPRRQSLAEIIIRIPSILSLCCPRDIDLLGVWGEHLPILRVSPEVDLPSFPDFSKWKLRKVAGPSRSLPGTSSSQSLADSNFLPGSLWYFLPVGLEASIPDTHHWKCKLHSSCVIATLEPRTCLAMRSVSSGFQRGPPRVSIL